MDHACIQVRIYESVNFREFVKLLTAFSPRASRSIKLEYMFRVYDVDGDGERVTVSHAVCRDCCQAVIPVLRFLLL